MLTEILTFLGAMIILFVILKVISLPIKIIIKLLINALIGGVVLFLINLTGLITLNITWITALIVGFLGIPGVVIVLLMHFFM